jgi:hypothetical protein
LEYHFPSHNHRARTAREWELQMNLASRRATLRDAYAPEGLRRLELPAELQLSEAHSAELRELLHLRTASAMPPQRG